MTSDFKKPWIFVRGKRGTYIEPAGTQAAGRVSVSRHDYAAIAQALIKERIVVYDGRFLLGFADNTARRQALSATTTRTVLGALYLPHEFTFQAIPFKWQQPVLAEGLTPPLSVAAKATLAEAAVREKAQARMQLLSSGRYSPSLT